jgi:glycerol-3-phosphate O-acyltransferase
LKAITRHFQTVDTKKKFEPILLEREDWPVVQMARNRKVFIERVKQESLERILKLRPTVNALIEELEVTRYRERLRYKTNPWKVDPDDEMVFWEGVKDRLVELNQTDRDKQRERAEAIVLDIIDRYANEIAGNFKPSHYRLARAVVTFGFARLLNATRIRRFGSFWSKEYTLQDKIRITGETELLRKLAKIGTIVMVPTHFSNLDSILIGWVIHTLGLPPFIYGAGLNLFNIEIFAYFMNSLGAYKVDRRKKNLVYLETLKTYSSLAIREGCHSLFFPGGTRSRSGKIESQLKLGLLSTSVEAQRINYQEHAEGRRSKIFIVPVVLNYHFVLEAPSLIRDYLQRKGQERYYLESDRYSTSMRILKFLLKFFTKGSSISVSIGRGLDLFGNYVDEEGRSVDQFGNYINTREYFMYQGKITADQQREEEYTRMLSNVIVREFHRINRVYGSHLVAYTAFQMLRKKYRKLDLYSMLRIPADEVEFEYAEFRETVGRLRDRIIELFNEGRLDMGEHMADDLDSIIQLGIDNVGMYHSKRPLLKNKQGNIISQDLLTLFYYHNRLDGYELEAYV